MLMAPVTKRVIIPVVCVHQAMPSATLATACMAEATVVFSMGMFIMHLALATLVIINVAKKRVPNIPKIIASSTV